MAAHTSRSKLAVSPVVIDCHVIDYVTESESFLLLERAFRRGSTKRKTIIWEAKHECLHVSLEGVRGVQH
jgi:hypothetical protein